MMKKYSLIEVLFYLITGLLPIMVYYLLTPEYFKISPAEGYHLLITIFLIVCYNLYLIAGRKISESIFYKKLTEFISAKTQLLIAFIFVPFIVTFKRNN
jgi:hypothetical protein